MKKLTEFTQKANQIHNNKYNYSKVVYINSRTKVCIICPIHGEFYQTPHSHLFGNGCKQCGIILSSKKLSLKFASNTTDFIIKSSKIHGNTYDYSKVEYINTRTKVCIICPDHGEFWQNPSSHIQGKGCPICGKNKRIQKRTFSLQSFIQKAKQVHGDKYDYSKVNYINANIPILIICPKHGEFYQTPSKHYIAKHGCPKCRQSKGEKQVEQWLKENNIDFIPQYRFKECKNILSLPFDFYLPKYNTCIEFDGDHHYRIIGNRIKNFQQTQKNDKIKNEYCQKEKIKLIRIPYKNFSKIDLILEEKILKM